MADAPGFAPLTAALVRRAPLPEWLDAPAEAEEEIEAGGSGWREDLRLFALTWAAGFVFFVTFLA